MTGGDERAPEKGPPKKGFKDRKREDHALVLIREVQASLDDLPKVRRLLLELGRYYDPVLGGALMEIRHQRAIVEALEAGRVDEARAMILARYDLYIKDRAHLGRGEEP